MTTPAFSIVIPTFDRSDLFPYAVKSILRQSFRDFEIIVSDNCSEDDTAEVARQFTDPRVRYVRTPRHFVIADAWEFARRHATGRLIMMLSDDDALLGGALARFHEESQRYDADFLFCRPATYRDSSFLGTERNSVHCPAFTGMSRLVDVDEFIRPLFLFRHKFDMHPSAFMFAKEIADTVERRTGRFFWTNGVEYSAWPIAATFTKCIAYIDVPLVILGRTAKSWGTNIALCNPGKERIKAFIDDVDHRRNHAPLSNFTMCNLIAEGMLTAKDLFPDKFEMYEFDEAHYLRRTMAELRQRERIGVDVSAEIEELLRYAAKYPSLMEEFTAKEPRKENHVGQQLLSSVASKMGARTLQHWLERRRRARKIRNGNVCCGFQASGGDFGFDNILDCAGFLTRILNGPLVDAPAPGGLSSGNNHDYQPECSATSKLGQVPTDSSSSRV
jgi:glycosyltransferase involved in cell wall biosynthesis